MRVVHIITRFILGGADENTLLTCNGQAAAGHEVTLICGSAYDQLMVDQLADGVAFEVEPTLVRSISPLDELKCYARLKKRLAALKPDVVHTHESKAGILGRLAAASASVKMGGKMGGKVEAPKIVHGVHILAFMNAGKVTSTIYKILERYAGKKTDAFIHVSDAMQQACIDNNVGVNSLHRVVPSGMLLEKYTGATPVDVNAALGTNFQTPPRILVMSGTLEKRKRVAEFVEAFAKIHAACPDTILVVGGDGAERPRIEQAIKDNNLENAVFLLGYTTELPSWIKAATLCVHVATHEGLPRVVIQYLTTDKPVVATHLEGLDTILKDDINGYIHQDINAVATKVIDILQQDTLYNRLQVGAAATDTTPWGADNMVNAIEAVYAEI